MAKRKKANLKKPTSKKQKVVEKEQKIQTL